MFAVIECGGKQYRVTEGDKFRVESLYSDDRELVLEGSKVDINNVVMIANGADIKLGKPYVKGAKVSLEVIANKRGEKILVFKKRRRQNSRRLNGHRQNYTFVKVEKITG